MLIPGAWQKSSFSGGGQSDAYGPDGWEAILAVPGA